MDKLVKETLAYIKQEFGARDTLLASPEDFDYFQEKKDIKPMPITNKAEIAPKTVALEPPSKPISDAMEEMRKIVAKAAPLMKLENTVPDDAEAKKVANMWQEQLKRVEVAVFSFGEAGKNLEFLQNVAKAIDALIAPAKVIDATRFEKEKKWNLFFEAHPLKLILAPDVKLWKATELATFYKENPSNSKSLLGESPLLFLQPTAFYLNNPKEKRTLWKAIVSHL